MKLVITGMGAVSPIGTDTQTFWKALCNGKSGISNITRFDTEGFAFTKGGEVNNLKIPDELIHDKENIDPATALILTAAHEALTDSHLLKTDFERNSAGIVLSTNFGGIITGERILNHNTPNTTPNDIEEYSYMQAATRIAAMANISGPRTTLSLSCSSGSAAIAHAANLICAGRAKIILAGGYDALSRFAWSGLSALRTMTKDAIRPFDKNRNGTLFSEGAGALIIEELEHAEKRGANIYAELTGWAFNNNAYHMTAPSKNGEGSAKVMEAALACGNINPNTIDHINTHGTGTKYNDITETQAIKTVFGKHAKQLIITSNKSETGHMMGAAGAVEAIASILSIQDEIIPPTINYEEPDPDCNLDCAVNTKREMKIQSVLSNSAGIGGCNAAVIFRKHE